MCQTRSRKHYWQCRAGKTSRIAVSLCGRDSNAKNEHYAVSTLTSSAQTVLHANSRERHKKLFLHKLRNHYLRGDETEIWREQWDKSWIAVDCSQRTRLKRVAACWWISIKFQCSFGCRTTAVKERRLKHDDSDIPDSQGSSERRFNHSFMFIRNNWGVDSAGGGSCTVTWYVSVASVWSFQSNGHAGWRWMIKHADWSNGFLLNHFAEHWLHWELFIRRAPIHSRELNLFNLLKRILNSNSNCAESRHVDISSKQEYSSNIGLSRVCSTDAMQSRFQFQI